VNKGPSGETTTKTEPWDPQQKRLKYGFQEARNLYDLGPYSYYPGSTVAGFSPEQIGAMEAQSARATYGSPVTAAAQQNATDTLSGAFLGSDNPYRQHMVDNIVGDVSSAVNSQFSGAGRYGSGAHQGVLADQLSKNIGAMDYQRYGDERTNQLRTQAFAPSLAAQDYQDISALGQVGQQRQQQAQAELGDEVQRFSFEQGAPYDSLQRYMQMINGSYGSTTSQPYYSNTGAGILGGALSGAQIGGAIPGAGAWGAGLGAIGGGLLGLF
jgi:hypothetical protein